MEIVGTRELYINSGVPVPFTVPLFSVEVFTLQEFLVQHSCLTEELNMQATSLHNREKKLMER